jgi:hypothetical protein
MRHIIDNPNRYNAYIFGNSRVGYIDTSKINNGFNWYNMSYAQGIPFDHLVNLQFMLQNNIIPKKIVIGLDDGAGITNKNNRLDDLMLLPFPLKSNTQNIFTYASFLIKYINPLVYKSLPIIISHKTKSIRVRGKSIKAQEKENISNEFDWENATAKVNFQRYIKEALADIKNIIDLCNANNIEIIIFTNPLHIITYNAVVKGEYLQFLTQLAEITDYYNFSSVNDVTTNNDLYFETSHYRPEVGDLIIECIFNNTVDSRLLSQGFGYYVTQENSTKFIALLKSQM